MKRGAFRFSVKQTSLANLRRSVQKFTKEKRAEVENLVATTALQIQGEARRDCPVDFGRLRSSIDVEFAADRLHAEIGSEVEYAPYPEFGTGDLVQIPVGAEEIAAQFRGAGIRKVNVAPRAYLFPAWERGRVSFLQGLKRIFGRAA